MNLKESEMRDSLYDGNLYFHCEKIEMLGCFIRNMAVKCQRETFSIVWMIFG